jgi:hypothetical protein
MQNENPKLKALRQELMLSKATHNFTFSRDELIDLLGGKFECLEALSPEPVAEPHPSHGSASARLDGLLEALRERFPKAHNKYSSAPPEPAFLKAIDDAIRDALFWETQSEEQSNTHVAGFQEMYRRTGIEDTGEYRWKWLLMEIQEFVGDAKRFAFFFDEDQKKPVTFSYAYLEGVNQDWNLVQWRSFFDEHMKANG